jgi:hypothetical protein
VVAIAQSTGPVRRQGPAGHRPTIRKRALFGDPSRLQGAQNDAINGYRTRRYPAFFGGQQSVTREGGGVSHRIGPSGTRWTSARGSHRWRKVAAWGPRSGSSLLPLH